MGLLHAVRLVLGWNADHFRSNAQLRAENALLRHQLLIAIRGRKKPQLTGSDRAIFVWLFQWMPAVRHVLILVKPETVARWHRAGFRAWWRWKSRHRGGRPRIDRELIDLIRRMNRENPLWGAPRIHGELLHLGFDVAESTVAKYMTPRTCLGGQSWRTFLRNYAEEIVAIDMLTVPTLTFECLYAFVVLGHGRRTILHVEVTKHPTAIWLARQITEAFPWDTAPKFLLRDNDGAYGTVFRERVHAMAIRDRPTAPHSPWQNGHVERLIGSIRRECLDHVIVLNADHLRRVLRSYAEYYNNDRTHLALGKDAPHSRTIEPCGTVVSRSVLNGLHHRYGRK